MRRVIGPCLAILAGASLTVAVAWLCQSRARWNGGPRGAWRYNGTPPAEFDAKLPAAWVVLYQRNPTAWSCLYSEWRSTGVTVEMYSVNDLTTTPWMANRREDYFTGWPFRALGGSAFRPIAGATTYTSMYRPPGMTRRELPTEVLPAGFVAGTLCYGAVVAAGWIGARAALRRSIKAGRQRRGLCPQCKYPSARVGVPCPECGHGALG